MTLHRTKIVFALALAIALLVLVNLGCGGQPAPEVTVAEEHDEHEEERAIQLDESTLKKLGIELAEAGQGAIEISTELPGEVQVNGDRMAHVAPRVGGVVDQVFASLGDSVRRGQVLAVLESRELADATATYLAAAERLKLADATFRREERLWNERVTSEQDYLDARRGLAEARIERRAAEQKMHALGFSQDDLEGLGERHEAEFTIYHLRAPFNGTVIDRHITIGETIEGGSPVFTVADLETIWIDLSVYQRDIGAVEAGQTVRVTTEHGQEAQLEIDFVQPLVGEETRTAKARIVAPNTDGDWHPGCFVTATVLTSEVEAQVVIPSSAVIRMDGGEDVVFVKTPDGFEPRVIALGRRSREKVEVISGLEPGERFVAEGGFSLKAELGKDAFGEGHGH